MSSLERSRRRCRLLVGRLVHPRLDVGVRRPWAGATKSLARRVIARIEEQDSGFQMTPPTFRAPHPSEATPPYPTQTLIPLLGLGFSSTV